MKLKHLIDEFLLTIQAHGNVNSPGTVEFNRRRIVFFADFVRDEQIADPLTPHAFRLYAAHIKTRPRNDGRPGPLSAYYVHGCLQTLKRFGQWLHDDGHTTGRNLADVISLPRLPHYRPNKAINKTDLARMIAACSGRDRALLLLLRDTGCRSCELLGMRWGDVDLNARHVWVTGKRQKSRWVFFVEETAEAIRAYRDQAPHEAGDPLWWGRIGRSDQAPLRYRGLYGILRRLAGRLDIEGSWNPHAWRHAFGKRMNKKGMSTLNLQALMGHESPETTLIYAEPDPEDLREIFDEYN